MLSGTINDKTMYLKQNIQVVVKVKVRPQTLLGHLIGTYKPFFIFSVEIL